jgi:SsrA-binding protein
MARGGKEVEIRNRKASYDYEFIEEEIAGISLFGSEVKSIRNGKASISEAYCSIQDGEMFIIGMHIAEYKESGRSGHDPYRKRKLLLTKKQINRMDEKIKMKGITVVPVKLFSTSKGLLKMKIALAKGKKNFDKRASIKERDIKRDMDREINK